MEKKKGAKHQQPGTQFLATTTGCSARIFSHVTMEKKRFELFLICVGCHPHYVFFNAIWHWWTANTCCYATARPHKAEQLTKKNIVHQRGCSYCYRCSWCYDCLSLCGSPSEKYTGAFLTTTTRLNRCLNTHTQRWETVALKAFCSSSGSGQLLWLFRLTQPKTWNMISVARFATIVWLLL